VGGAGGVCNCFIVKIALVVSQSILRGMHLARGMLGMTIVQIALTCERAMPTAGRTAAASRGASPGPPRFGVAPQVKRAASRARRARGAFELNSEPFASHLLTRSARLIVTTSFVVVRSGASHCGS
jgi:hypothetical protein